MSTLELAGLTTCRALPCMARRTSYRCGPVHSNAPRLLRKLASERAAATRRRCRRPLALPPHLSSAGLARECDDGLFLLLAVVLVYKFVADHPARRVLRRLGKAVAPARHERAQALGPTSSARSASASFGFVASRPSNPRHRCSAPNRCRRLSVSCSAGACPPAHADCPQQTAKPAGSVKDEPLLGP